MNPVYRITVQKLNLNGTLDELVEIMEMECPAPWTTVFDFVDQYRAGIAQEEALEGLDSPLQTTP